MDKQEWMVTDNDLKKIWDDEQGSPHVETAMAFAQKKLLEYLKKSSQGFTKIYHWWDFESMLKELEGK